MIKDSVFIPIKGFKDYGVNQNGEVFSFKTSRILKQGNTKKGYKQVCLTVDGTKITKRVHRLVAETFVENPNGKDQVNHINGDKTDNRVKNLEWCNNSENQKHSYRVLKNPNNGGGGGKKAVVCIETNKTYISMSKASKDVNAKVTNISRACRYPNYTAGGFHWRFEKGGREICLY